MAVVIETTLGDLTVDLFLEQRPRACLNFLKLCKMKYYNFSLFHSIQSGFIAQAGDPTGAGTGGESIWGVLEGSEKRYFSAERVPRIRHSDVGMLSMVCVEDSLVGSQFFFTLGPELDSLDATHCVIGIVTEGHDVLRKLNEVICDEGHRPYRDVRVTHTVVLEDPFADPPGLRAPSRSPSPSAERLIGGRIAPDEEIDETQGKTIQEINEIIEEKEAKARATILEIVGDLPDADIAPPENVLFVCKLNPVTTDSDLEIIFSRFGKIVNCEIIRDKKTGDSLQYAFIEFDDKKSCESAYFKMDNVLIDDRRIHVDFSQSVSKVRYLGKGRVKHINQSENSKNDITNAKVKRRSRSRGREVDRSTDRERNVRDRDKGRHSDREKDRNIRERDRKRNSPDRSRKSRDRNRIGREREKSQDKDRSRRNRDRGNRERDGSQIQRKDERNQRGNAREDHRRRERVSKSRSPIARDSYKNRDKDSRSKKEMENTKQSEHSQHFQRDKLIIGQEADHEHRELSKATPATAKDSYKKINKNSSSKKEIENIGQNEHSPNFHKDKSTSKQEVDQDSREFAKIRSPVAKELHENRNFDTRYKREIENSGRNEYSQRFHKDDEHMSTSIRAVYESTSRRDGDCENNKFSKIRSPTASENYKNINDRRYNTEIEYSDRNEYSQRFQKDYNSQAVYESGREVNQENREFSRSRSPNGRELYNNKYYNNRSEREIEYSDRNNFSQHFHKDTSTNLQAVYEFADGRQLDPKHREFFSNDIENEISKRSRGPKEPQSIDKNHKETGKSAKDQGRTRYEDGDGLENDASNLSKRKVFHERRDVSETYKNPSSSNRHKEAVNFGDEIEGSKNYIKSSRKEQDNEYSKDEDLFSKESINEVTHGYEEDRIHPDTKTSHKESKADRLNVKSHKQSHKDRNSKNSVTARSEDEPPKKQRNSSSMKCNSNVKPEKIPSGDAKKHRTSSVAKQAKAEKISNKREKVISKISKKTAKLKVELKKLKNEISKKKRKESTSSSSSDTSDESSSSSDTSSSESDRKKKKSSTSKQRKRKHSSSSSSSSSSCSDSDSSSDTSSSSSSSEEKVKRKKKVERKKNTVKSSKAKDKKKS